MHGEWDRLPTNAGIWHVVVDRARHLARRHETASGEEVVRHEEGSADSAHDDACRASVGHIRRNVAPLANAPSLTTARSHGPEMRVWSPDELSHFLEAIEGDRNEALFRFMAMTGARRSEAAGLRWSDLDLARSRATIMQAATVVDGDEVLGAPKSRRSRRVLDLDTDTVAILRRHKVERAETYLRLGISATAGDRVFANDIGGPLRPNSVGQAFRRLASAHGLPEIRLHDLVHTHATHLLAAGVNVKVVSERLGHASVSFTLDTYAHVMPGQQADAAAAAAALLRKSQ